MSDEGAVVPPASETNTGKWLLLALAVIYVVGSLYFLFDLRSQVSSLTKDDQTTKAQLIELTRRMQASEASDETLAQQVGMTKKELAARAADLQRQTRAAEARLAAPQKTENSPVTREAAPGQTDAGGVQA